MRTLKLLVPVLFVVGCFSGCAEVEDSASRAFDNANSVVTSARPVLWGDNADQKPSAKSEVSTREEDETEARKE